MAEQEKGVVQYNNISLSGKGNVSGVFKMNRDGIAWRSKGGQTFSIIRADINTIQWARNSRQYQLRVSVKAGANYKYDGFNETDQRNLSQFIKENYSIDPKLMEISTKGLNAGSLKVEGRVLAFFVDDKRAFELPLNEVAQSSNPAKNEVQIEFHHDDTAGDDAESLVEMRLYVPNIKENTNGEAPEGEAAAAADEKTRAEVRHRANITLIPSSSKFFLILASYV
jgi:structure-specific recognition protein 1